MVEHQTPEREVGGFETYLHRVMSKTLYSPKVLVIPRKRWLRPDMTEQHRQTGLCLTWTQGYKTFFMLNSAEHEIYPAHKS